jgi:S-DNA-T family DNA segregation ATPase FtsK/SpoIIIE
MRSNMKWRVCLRVETGADSRELLKREDAAYLPNTVPGRGYIQVGNDNIELMQVARAGGPYSGPLPDYLQDKYAGDTPALTDVLSYMMRHLMDTNPDVVEQKKPYPDPLPRLLTLDQHRSGEGLRRQSAHAAQPRHGGLDERTRRLARH